MDNHRLEKHIKDQLNDHRVGINKDDLWNGIQKKKRKNRMFWFLLPGLAIFILGSYFIFSNIQPSNNLTVSSTSINKNKKEATSIENETPSLINDVNYQANEKSIIDEKATNAAVANTQQKSDNIISSGRQKDKQLHQNKTTQKESKQASQVIEAKVITSSNSSPATPYSFVTTRPSTTSSVNGTKILADNNARHKKNEASNTVTPLALENILTTSLLPKSKIPSFAFNNQTPELSGKIMEVKAFEDRVINNKAKNLKFGLGVYSIYSLVNKSLTSDRDKELLELKVQTEKPLENLAYGIDLKVDVLKGFYVSAGIQFQSLTERIDNFEILSVEPVSAQGIVKNINYADGTIEAVEGQIEEIHTRTRNYEVYNSFNRWDIPIAVGYHTSIKNWLLEGELGMTLNLSNTFDGYTYGKDAKLTNTFNPFLDKLSPQAYVAFGVGYYFTDRMSFILKPTIQLQRWNVSQAEINNPVEQTYQLTGLNGSIRYNF